MAKKNTITKAQLKEVEKKAAELRDTCSKYGLRLAYYLPSDDWDGYVFAIPDDVENVPVDDWNDDDDDTVEHEEYEVDDCPFIFNAECHSAEAHVLRKA